MAQTKGISAISRTFERGSDRFRALLRTRDAALAAEWIAVLHAACGRQRAHGMEQLQSAIISGDVHAAAGLAERLASLSAAVPGRPRQQSSSARGSPPLYPTTPDTTPPPFGQISAMPQIGGRSSRNSSGHIEVPARHHYASSDDNGQSCDSQDEVQEVAVVLRPAMSGEKRFLREQLAVAHATIASQRHALESAHAALARLGAHEDADAARRAVCASPTSPPAAMGQTVQAEVVSVDPLTGREPSHELSASVDLRPEAMEGAEVRSSSFASAGSYISARSSSQALGESPAADAPPAGPTPSEELHRDGGSTAPPGADAMAQEQVAMGGPQAAAQAGARVMEEEWVEEGGRPKAGWSTADEPGLQLENGDGTQFKLRIGPDYKRHGKKAASISHIYAPMTIDVFKRKKIAYHLCATHPPPDARPPPAPR